MDILVIDGMGGGIGRSLLEEIFARQIAENIIAVGVNSIATQAMLKSGVKTVATGENAVIFNAGRANIILGPMGIIVPNAMYGEISPKMAAAVSSSSGEKILVPINNQNLYIAGVSTDDHLSRLVKDSVDILLRLLESHS